MAALRSMASARSRVRVGGRHRAQVITPTWVEIGQLAAIAVIRTFLNYFLEKDVEQYAESRQGAETQRSPKRQPARADSRTVLLKFRQAKESVR